MGGQRLGGFGATFKRRLMEVLSRQINAENYI